jgi:ribosomal protein S21
MDEREDTAVTKLKRAYARVRVCADVRRHELKEDLEEIERLEREVLAAHEQWVREQSN